MYSEICRVFFSVSRSNCVRALYWEFNRAPIDSEPVLSEILENVENVLRWVQFTFLSLTASRNTKCIRYVYKSIFGFSLSNNLSWFLNFSMCILFLCLCVSSFISTLSLALSEDCWLHLEIKEWVTSSMHQYQVYHWRESAPMWVVWAWYYAWPNSTLSFKGPKGRKGLVASAKHVTSEFWRRD